MKRATSKNPRRPSTQRNNTYQRFSTKNYVSKPASRIDFLDSCSRNTGNDIYTNSRDNNTLYDIYSNTSKSKKRVQTFYGKKKLKQMNEKEDVNSSRM